MEQKRMRQKPDKETVVFILFFIGIAVYYGWRMFMLTPWYDELYTYYYFISRGPLYAAIHWPVPNNHIGYSVLSACLNIFGNSTIALRGISYLCSMGGLIVLYRIGRMCFDHGMALMPVFLYTGMKLTNWLAVQGRGYALVSFCYLTSIYMLLHITVENRNRNRIRDYLIYAICLIIALYAIPSSVYVVVPVCLTGGAVLLFHKRYRKLVWLILTSMASAVCTLGLYGIVWLAIGSNLLTKTEGSAYYGMGHVSIILHAPIQALKTGVDYMLATPYIQSVDRESFRIRFVDWLRGLLNEYYVGAALVLAVLLLICAGAALIRIITSMRRKAAKSVSKEKRLPDTDLVQEHIPYDRFMEIYLVVGIICVPLMLVIQCSLPYYRVFSFAGITAALALAWLWQMIQRLLRRRFKLSDGVMTYAGSAVTFATGVLCVVLLFTPAYRMQYSDREAAIEDAYRHVDVMGADKIAVTDCDQEYLLLFIYDIGGERITRQPEEAEIVLADKYLLLQYNTDITDWSGDDWKLYLTPEQFEASDVTHNMEAVYENERFVVYANK